MDIENIKKYLRSIKTTEDVVEIAKHFEVEPYIIYGIANEMINEGAMLTISGTEIIKLKKPLKTNGIYNLNVPKEHVRLLLISDTHLANKADRLDILRYVYDKAEKTGVDAVLHSGDLLDGIFTNRPQQLLELRCYGYDAHLEYVVKNYPKYSGKTFFCMGNHESTYIRNGGAEIGKAIAREREDMVYLGDQTGEMKIGNLRVHLHHGYGGQAYSRSYKLQRYAETFTEDKPHIIQTGHVHNAFYMYYNGIHCFQTGSLEDPTPFSKSLGLPNEKSVWWVDADVDSKGNLISITPQLEVFGDKIKRR